MTEVEQLQHDLKMADTVNGKLIRLIEVIEKVSREENEPHVAMTRVDDAIRDWRGIPSHDDLLTAMVGEEEIDETQIIEMEPD